MIEITRGHFEGLPAALDECARLNLYPSILIPSDDYRGGPTHWHDHDVHVFVLEGKAQVYNEKGELMDIGAGDRILIPERTLHREAPAVQNGNAIILIAFPRPMTPVQVIERNPADLH